MWQIDRRIIVFISCLAILGVITFTFIIQTTKYPSGMDADMNGNVTISEWKAFHLNVIDSDGSGEVSRKEWNNFYVTDNSANSSDWKKIRYNELNIDRKGNVSLEEWLIFHSIIPEFYGGYNEAGYIQKENKDYYSLEFARVDCNHNLEMDKYEFNELGLNLRWCSSPARTKRPWWR